MYTVKSNYGFKWLFFIIPTNTHFYKTVLHLYIMLPEYLVLHLPKIEIILSLIPHEPTNPKDRDFIAGYIDD